MTDDSNRLHIDSDWKAQAQAEKERLAEKEASREGTPEGGELPAADFRGLIMTLGSQAMMGLGAYGDPQTGRVMIDLPGAQFAIDLLGVLEEKTKGNLTADEATELTEVVGQLRARFVYVAKLVAAQMQQQAAGGMPGVGGMGGMDVGDIAGSIGPGGAASKSGLIMPD